MKEPQLAGLFQPKFADLVRNYTTTMGTDDFVLGATVNGFASFADECAIGDSFYYSAMGVDKPAEREVGRGTLIDGGVISRDPISGTKTQFTSGTKSIALVAASEWFREVDAARSAAGPVSVKSFGAKGDSSRDGSTGTDDTAAIQRSEYSGRAGGNSACFGGSSVLLDGEQAASCAPAIEAPTGGSVDRLRSARCHPSHSWHVKTTPPYRAMETSGASTLASW
jgi:hypothetical protein